MEYIETNICYWIIYINKNGGEKLEVSKENKEKTLKIMNVGG
jgi:hypothetical protein